ncbi:hypothetical protein IWZ01DRAFT_486387 [Phyllosticta capitalensis]
MAIKENCKKTKPVSQPRHLDPLLQAQSREAKERSSSSGWAARAPHPPPLPPSPRYHASTSTSSCSAPQHIRVGGLTQPNEATQGTRWADRRRTDSMYCLHGVRRLRCIQNTETADLAAIAFSDAIIACLLARTFNANVDGCFQTLHDGMTRWLGHSGWHEAREKSMATWARWAKNGRPLEGNAARTPQEKADENEMAEEEVSTASSLLYTNKPLGQSRYKDSTQDKTPTFLSSFAAPTFPGRIPSAARDLPSPDSRVSVESRYCTTHLDARPQLTLNATWPWGRRSTPKILPDLFSLRPQIS